MEIYVAHGLFANPMQEELAMVSDGSGWDFVAPVWVLRWTHAGINANLAFGEGHSY